MYRRILAPTDGSEVSAYAADAAIGFARERHRDPIFMGAPVPVMVLRPPAVGVRVQAFARPCPASVHA